MAPGRHAACATGGALSLRAPVLTHFPVFHIFVLAFANLALLLVAVPSADFATCGAASRTAFLCLAPAFAFAHTPQGVEVLRRGKPGRRDHRLPIVLGGENAFLIIEK